MTNDEPYIFNTLCPYTRTRLMIASAAIFRKAGLKEWSYGHEKLFGVILWHYEINDRKEFKYNRLLKREGYGRTQNYKLLKAIVENNILLSIGNGKYKLNSDYIGILDSLFKLIHQIDEVSKPDMLIVRK